MGNRGRWLALVATAAPLAVVPATTHAAPKKRVPAVAAIAGVTGPKAAVVPGAKVVLTARARNMATRTSRVSVAFHTSVDARRDGRDPVLGRARTARLKPGGRGTAKLTAALRPAIRPGTYTLFACVRAGGRTRCAKATRKLVVRTRRLWLPTPVPKVPTPPAPEPPRPRDDDALPPDRNPVLTLQVASDVEWSTGRRPDGNLAASGDTIRSVLRLGAGVPGQAGYDRASVPAGAATGDPTPVAGGALAPPAGGFDNGSIPLDLPFAFPFAGVRTTRVAVSTNGWIAAADPSPAFGPIGADASIDYRGIATAFGDNLAAIAPFRTDLTLVPPPGQVPGRIVLVRQAGGDSVAIRWEAYPVGGGARVTFAAVLFRDGRVRFDYPERPAFAADRLVGISPGVSGQPADLTVARAPAIPAESILFTPRPAPRRLRRQPERRRSHCRVAVSSSAAPGARRRSDRRGPQRASSPARRRRSPSAAARRWRSAGDIRNGCGRTPSKRRRGRP